MFQNFTAELRDNPRLRWGLLLIIGVLGLYAILVLHDSLQEQIRLHRAATLSLARAQKQAEQTEWLARVDPARALSVQLEARLWQAPSSGLAQAAFQDFLNSAMQRPGVTRPQIAVALVEEAAPGSAGSNPVPGQGQTADLWKVRAKITFEATAPAMLALLGQMENYEKQIVVGVFSMSKNLPNAGEMELYAYFQKPTAPEPAPAQKPKQPS